GNGVFLYINGIHGPGTTSGNVVLGNMIGTDVTGTAKLGNTEAGVRFGTDSVSQGYGPTANTVGGTAAGSANVISGNGGAGVYIQGAGTSGNVVLGNRIGTDVHGTAKLGNTGNGVE